MARKRMVDPGLWTSESVARMPVEVRYAWIGLWSYLDDTGRGKDNASLVKASVWPLDDEMTAAVVREQLDLLIAGGQLCAYTCCDQAQIHAPQWTVFQKISHPTATRLCACPGHESKASSMHRSELGITPEEFARRSGGLPRSVVEVSGEKGSSGVAPTIPRQQTHGPCPGCSDCPPPSLRSVV